MNAQTQEMILAIKVNFNVAPPFGNNSALRFQYTRVLYSILVKIAREYLQDILWIPKKKICFT